ncbi:Protein CBR-SRXA-9 [Caenorhabditis briggsae]|nr:Protein CBR-SRXA-9 [Caenorhabditis briggsae]CAP27406.2 Protein CBR-SRXA-9 [Caenorhabditis briggsae]
MAPESFVVLEWALYICSFFYPLIFFVFDLIMFLAVYRNRNDSCVPVAYMTVMSSIGMLTTFAMCVNSFVYMVLPKDYFEDKSHDKNMLISVLFSAFISMFGAELTLAGSFSYLNALFITVLMTINRIYMALYPFRNNDVFTQPRIFFLCGVISIITFTSMIIPYFSPCYVVFRIESRSFMSGCAPNRHPITAFQNEYAIAIPVTCMFSNFFVVFHFYADRKNLYIKFINLFLKNKRELKNNGSNTSLNDIQARRERTLMRSTTAVTAYLAIYEVGAFLIRTFPTQYAGLPEPLRIAIFYFRYESIPIMNFFIYYVETHSTRQMIRRFLKIKDKKVNTTNTTVVTVAARAQTAGRRRPQTAQNSSTLGRVE